MRNKNRKVEDDVLGSVPEARRSILRIVLDSWLQFDQARYQLHAWVIMPNRVHVLLQTIEPNSLSSVVKSWKSFSAGRINGLLSRQGALWQREYWDRFIRNEEHYVSAIAYIHENPVKAGLVSRSKDWPWSSAGAGYADAAGTPAPTLKERNMPT